MNQNFFFFYEKMNEKDIVRSLDSRNNKNIVY